MENLNIRNIKLTFKKSYGKKHVGEDFLTCPRCFYAMSILDYFKPVSGLPDPRGELSRSLTSAAIASANVEATRTLNAQLSRRKNTRGSYNQ